MIQITPFLKQLYDNGSTIWERNMADERYENFKAYWKYFGIGAAASFVLMFGAGCLFDLAREGSGDPIRAMGELWTYLVFFGLLYSVVWRPWRRKVWRPKATSVALVPGREPTAEEIELAVEMGSCDGKELLRRIRSGEADTVPQEPIVARKLDEPE